MSVNSTNANSVIEGYENISSPLDYFRLMKPRVMSLDIFRHKFTVLFLLAL